MTEYYVNTTTKTVDGSAYTSDDTIIIKGGARGYLRFQNFKGDGSYIPIINENGASKVEIDGAVASVCMSIHNCKYVDLRGNNDSGIPYGIKVINDATSQASLSVKVHGESDHIKLSYLEVTCEGNPTSGSSGINVSDANLTSAWTFSNFEIHHNYIHDTRYAGMYLGGNDPRGNNKPYLGTFSIHDNLLEDLGAYGITYKGINGPNNYIYDNIIRGSSGGQSTGIVRTDLKGNSKHGIGTQFIYNNHYIEIYNNRIDKTVGPGLKIGGYGHQVHDNIVCGCGSGNEPDWGHGIKLRRNPDRVVMYDNIIIQPKRYGIYAGGQTSNCTDSRNLIGDAGLGERYDKSNGGMTEGTGANANIYHANVADFGFAKWSNDGDYRNDDFTIITATPKGRIVSLNYPLSVQHGATVDIDAAIKNIGELSGLFKMQLWRDGVLKATSPQFILASGETSTDKINPFTAPTSGAKMAMAIKCIRTEE